MKTFLVACVIAIIVAVGGAFVLNGYQQTAQQAFKTPYVRLGA